MYEEYVFTVQLQLQVSQVAMWYHYQCHLIWSCPHVLLRTNLYDQRDVLAVCVCVCVCVCARARVCTVIINEYHCNCSHLLCIALTDCAFPSDPLPSTPSPRLVVCALQCYCHFDPGATGYIKACSGQPRTCNVTGPQAACFYSRGQIRIPNSAGTTITVEYGCRTETDVGFNCNTLETDVALTQCCDTDLCNQNFSKRLASEQTVTTTTPTPTSSKESSKMLLLHCMYTLL